MIARRSPVPRILIVAKINFQAKTTSEWNHFMKCFVVSNEPGRDHQRHRPHGSQPQAHAPRNGATDITTGSVRPPNPLSAPKPTQCHTDDEVSRCSATRKTRLINKVVSVVAQMKSAEKKIA